MKSLLIAVLFSSVFTMGSKAQDVPASINQSFKASFPFATKASWTEVGKLYKAEFVLDREYQYAFFTKSGELAAESRYIRFQDLPDRLSYSLIKQFPNYNISEVFEVQIENDHDYYVTLERDGVNFTLKASNRTWKLFSNK